MSEQENRCGVLRVDFTTLHDALHLPDQCKIVAVLRDGLLFPYAELIVKSPVLPVVQEGHPIPPVRAICSVDPCPDHEVCPDCRKMTTTIGPIQEEYHA